MISKRSVIHFRVINIWFGFVLFLILISNLSHQAMPILSWLNLSLFFLVLLQCVFIFGKELYRKAIFVNIGLLSLVYSLSFINPFVGNGYAFGNDYLANYIFQYRTMALSFLLALAITYICVLYIFDKITTLKAYSISFVVILPIFVWHFYPYLANRDYLLSLPDNTFLYESVLLFTFYSFFMVCLYGYFLYKNEKSLGEHINSLMVCFFIMTLADITDTFARVYNIKLFSLSQYILLPVLSVFIITLFRKLNYIYSDFGQFYDTLITEGNKWGVPIKRKKSAYALSFLSLVRAYLHQKRNVFGLATLSLVFCVSYFDVSPFLKLHLIALVAGMIVLFFYLSALYHKRLSNGDLLSLHRHTH